MNQKENFNTQKGILRQVSQSKNQEGIYVLGEENNRQFIYKYLNMDVVLKKLKYDSIELRFQQLSQWDDEYETLFYNADYSKVTNDKSTHPKLYACCFTLSELCEAAWKIYGGSGSIGKNCVRLKFNKELFEKELVKYAEKNGFKVYAGTVDYRRKNVIDKIPISSTSYKKNESNIKALHNELFCNGDFRIDNYLSLLLLKRDAFEYEKEYRYFLVPNDNAMKDMTTYKKVNIPLRCVEENDGSVCDVLESIMTEHSCDQKTFDYFNKIYFRMGLGQLIEDIDLYLLDDNLKNIKIEK